MTADAPDSTRKTPPVCTVRDFRVGVGEGMIDLDLEAHEGAVITWRMAPKLARKVGQQLYRMGYFESASKRTRPKTEKLRSSGYAAEPKPAKPTKGEAP